jgi:bifunctional non-homologous end joining protein LigD
VRGIDAAFARAVAQALEEVRSLGVVSSMRKDLRKGKVFVDWSQNDEHKSTVAPYSLRARETAAGPSVSTPIEWDELEAAVDADDATALQFTPADVLDRLDRLGDLHAAVAVTAKKGRR